MSVAIVAVTFITQSHLVYVTDHTTAVQSDVYCIVADVRSPKYIPSI